MKKVRWGLLSTANINQQLIPAIRSSARGELAAVASRSQESAEAYAAEWGIPTAFGSYEAMLASDAVDVVYISLPNHMHVPWSIAAMEHGKHVLCEKPFAINIEDVDRVAEVSARTGMVIAEAFMYRHHPQTKIAGEFIRSGRLGEVTVLRGVFNFRMPPGGNVRLVQEWGGGSIWDVGCYPISIAQFFFGGPPAEVFGDQVIGPSGVDEVFVGQMRWADGRLAQITSGFRTPFFTSVDVLGSEGRLSINSPFRIDVQPWEGNQLLFHPAVAGSEPEKILVPEEPLYNGEVADMHAAILDGAEPYISLGESKDHIRTILALVESASSKKVVEL